jgi:NTE family protein
MVRALFTEASVLDPDYFRRVVDFFLPDVDLDEARIPFFPVATDLLSGQPVPLTTGSLRRAVLASSSVPGIAPSVQIEGRYLVDGGAACLVPVEVALRQQGALTVGVGVDRDIETESPPETALDAYLRAGDIVMARLGQLLIAQAQVSIRPQVGHIHWLEFDRAKEIMDLGAAAAEEAWPRIQEALHRPSFAERLAERLWFRG